MLIQCNTCQVSSAPLTGAMIGSVATQQTLDMINRSTGGIGFFGTDQDPYRDRYIQFQQQIVMPMRQQILAAQTVARNAGIVDLDLIRPLSTLDDLATAPQCMQLEMASYAPMRELIQNGCIDGYGYDAQDLLPPTYVDDMIMDYVSTFGDGSHNEDLKLELVVGDHQMYSNTDKLHFAETFDFIDDVLLNTNLDPSDPSIERS